MIEGGIITALGAIWILSRMNLKRIVGYALFWDIALTALFTWLFIGTYAGMVTGMLAGVIVSVFLTIVKKTTGAERLGLTRHRNDALPRVRWKKV